MRQIYFRVLDDLDQTEGAEPHTLRLDDVEIELDLCPENYQELRDLLAVYFKAGTRTGNGEPRETAVGGISKRDFNKQLRGWAAANGRSDEIKEPVEGGRRHYYYPTGLVQDFKNYLEQQAQKSA